jgi:replicative DNA helicase
MNLTPEQPNSIEAEICLLGSILIDPECIRHCASVVQPTDFFIARHQMIYTAMLDLHARSLPIDFVTLCDALDKRNQLKDIGGTPAISSLCNSVPTAIHAHAYARIIVDASVRRGLLCAASKIAEMAYDESGDTEAQKARAIRLVSDVRGGRQTARPVAEVASGLYDQIMEWSNDPLTDGNVRGTSTGFRSIDQMLGGLEGGLLYILAGRPGMGKSALAFQIGHNVARQGKHVAIFSVEMGARQVLSRLVCASARVTWENIKRGHVKDDEWPILIEKINHVAQLPMTIDDSSRMTTAAIDSTLARLGNVDLAIVDHLGLLSDVGVRGENETIRLGRISWALKQIAKDYKLPVISVCQLNREVDKRDNKRPVLADLRQSGNIEENADDVLMIYRDDYYNKESSVPNIAEIWPRKLRDGDIDAKADLHFDKPFATFFPIGGL